MPLSPLSPNIQESEATSRKRTHGEYAQESDGHLFSKPASMSSDAVVANGPPQLPSAPDITMKSPTPDSSPAALTEAGSSTPARHSTSPNITPSKSTLETSQTSDSTNSVAPPSSLPSTQAAAPTTGLGSAPTASKPAKKKLTPAEKEAQERERAEKKRKREEEAVERAAEKAKKAAEKAKLDAERDAKRRKKEEDAAEKAAEKAKVEAEKEAKRKKKEEEELAASRKKERQASMMKGFFLRGPSVPAKKVAASPASPTKETAATASPVKTTGTEKSHYDKVFKPFYIKEGVRLAASPFHMDDTTKDLKLRKLDEYVTQERNDFEPKSFDPMETFQFSGLPISRGIIPKSVKTIMDSVYDGLSSNPFGAQSTAPSTDSQVARLASAQEQLDQIPVRYLHFREDVRPPYIGTVTNGVASSKLRALSRRPNRRVMPQLNYDYDSEAEWVEEDGEDIEDCDDEEEDDGDEEMDDFLDDSEDAPQARPAYLGENEPTSSGICFENQERVGPCAAVNEHRMEFLLDTLELNHSIDPFSTVYWEPVAKAPAGKAAPTSKSSSDSKSMPPPAGPSDAFSALLVTPATGAAQTTSDKDLVPKDVFEDFKKAVVSPGIREHTKATVIDLLSVKFTKCTKAQVKTTLDKIAERAPVPGEKKSVKHWVLLPNFAISVS